MAYWWVSQNKTFHHESTGGYLWAPLHDSRGNTPYHWKNMERIQAGDLIFSYVGRAVAAVSIALDRAHPGDQPAGFEAEGDWNAQGLRVPARYFVLPDPIPVKSLPGDLLALLKGEFRPLDVNGDGKQAYLFEVSPEAGRRLFESVEERVGEALDLFEEPQPGATNLSADAKNTERESLVKSRLGQGQFKDALMKQWRSKCALTGVSTECVLRGSHIKPWKDSNNRERLDPNNGFLLAAGVDAAFDAGLITFEDDGRVRFSNLADPSDLALMGITAGMRITGLIPAHILYLNYHRRHVFIL